MANFELIKHTLEGTINTQLNATRTNQGAWEWFNALYRIVSQNRFTGTATIYGPTLVTAATVVTTSPGTLFGALIDNAMSAEDAYLAVADDAAFVAGTDNAMMYLWAPRASQVQYVFCNGISWTVDLSIEDILGTEAGLEAGTGSTSGVTVVLVYTT